MLVPSKNVRSVGTPKLMGRLVFEVQSRVVAAKRVLGEAGLEKITWPPLSSEFWARALVNARTSRLGSGAKGCVSHSRIHSLGIDVGGNAHCTLVMGSKRT
jgi:hypothetical protein